MRLEVEPDEGGIFSLPTRGELTKDSLSENMRISGSSRSKFKPSSESSLQKAMKIIHSEVFLCYHRTYLEGQVVM